MNPMVAERFRGMSGSVIREIFKMLADPEIISFAGGAPAKECMPIELITRFSSELLAEKGAQLLQYGISEGYPALRESLTEWVKHLDICCQASEVLITTGAQQGIDLFAKTLLNPGDVVLVESPTFLAALQVIHTYQGRAVPVAMDEQGLIPEALEEAAKRFHPKYLYTIPTFQNPTGCTLSLERRKEVLRLAEKYDFLVLEDDPYRDLRYHGEELPTMKSMDETGRVSYLGSFSKVVSPGLRVGFLIPSPALLGPLVIGKQATDVHTPTLNQAVVDRLIRENLLWPHVQQTLPLYRAKLDTALACMEQEFPADVRFTRPEGGLFIWCTLPEGMDAQPLFKACVERKVAFVPGLPFFTDEVAQPNTFRCNFSASNLEQLRFGIDQIAQVIRLMRA